MKSVVYIFALFIWIGNTCAQVVLDRNLIGSGNSEYSSQTFNLSASVGEVVVQTLVSSEIQLTQGFQQSNYVMSNALVLDLVATDAACIGANDGSVTISFVSSNVTEPLTYQWSTGATTPSIGQLEAGQYSVTVTGANGKAVSNQIEVATIENIDCTPGFYIGITPNNDDHNDYWHIDNAAFFLQKRVEIYNRYGILVWSSNDYNNESGAFKGLHSNGNPLPDGTYYFIAKFDNSTYKGWIEISR